MAVVQVSLFGFMFGIKNFSPQQMLAYVIGEVLLVYWLPDFVRFARSRSGVLVSAMFGLGILQVSTGVMSSER